MPIKNTPLIAQYLRVKEKVPDAILFFRLGDFYEMFFEDAELGARVLDIQLTSRSKDGVPLCGVPYHSVEPYIAKLLKAGHKVAICEQTNDGDDRARERTGPGLVPRRIVRIITPGTVNEETVLSADEKNFLLALAPADGGFAIAALDVSTGEFVVTRLSNQAALRDEITRLVPREILAPAGGADFSEDALSKIRCPITRLGNSDYDATRVRSALSQRFGEAYALADPALELAAGAALIYVEQTLGGELGHLQPPRFYNVKEFLLIDEVSRVHLELIASSDGDKRGSLLSILNATFTPIGARTLSSWIVYPLLDLGAITRRHDAVEELFDSDLGGPLTQALTRIGDLERVAGRIGSLRATPRDCAKLAQALDAVATVKESLAGFKSAALSELAAILDPQLELVTTIGAVLGDEPPINPRDGNVIRTGHDPQVDELRALASDARGFIARIEARERERSKIGSLKVRYNQIFGYYIEVTKPHLDRVPADYERKQTLVAAERFTTPELKELERKILSAESGLKELEHQIFVKLLRSVMTQTAALQQTARAIGELDALIALASVARRRGYVRPQMSSGSQIVIRDGRHPVLESGMKSGEFVPNDLDVDREQRQLLLITGPNMAGKSTYLRQVALIVIMAQMGSFVPASEARIGVVDRIFTRIGARDELRRGESTFMVEMRETARLLQGLSERSLLLLDEVGRGTSTFDGLAIAWAVAEFLHDSTRAKVLFATHFHELTDLARERPRVKNLTVAVREWGGEVAFLRRVVEGAASRSYGIEVARLAGLPDAVIRRAREILSNLEQGEFDERGMPRLARERRGGAPPKQISLFAPVESRVLDELKLMDVDRLTPIEALNELSRIASKLKSGSE